jgi:hypothetical protein
LALSARSVIGVTILVHVDQLHVFVEGVLHLNNRNQKAGAPIQKSAAQDIVSKKRE